VNLDVFSIGNQCIAFNEPGSMISNQENIEVYVVNLDVFSIGNQCFAFNEPGSDS